MASHRDSKSDIGDMISETATDVGARVGAMASKAQETLTDARDSVIDATGRVRDAATDMRGNVRRMIKDNPLVAVALGIGAGYLIGRRFFFR